MGDVEPLRLERTVRFKRNLPADQRFGHPHRDLDGDEDQALIGVGATLLRFLGQPTTVSTLWKRVRLEPNVGTFERFALASNLLYVIGAIDLRDGLIVRANR
jgi:hypothetical protein